MRQLHASLRAPGAVRFTCMPAAVVAFALLPGVAWAQGRVKVPEANLMLRVPAGSTIVTRQTPGAQAKHSPGWVMDVVGPAVSGFKANYNLRTGPAEPRAMYSIGSAAKMSDQFKQAYPNARTVTFHTLMVGGEKAVAITGTIPMPGRVIRTKVIQFSHAGTRYTLTFTSTEKAFYKQVGAFDKSVASIRWL